MDLISNVSTMPFQIVDENLVSLSEVTVDGIP
jgi:hypothetical protein